MSDWKYEINDGLVAFYENGIERNIDKVFDTLNAAESRIAELSQAVGLITTLKPTMVMDTEHPLDMAKEVVEYVTVRIAELEVLVEGHDPFEDFPPKERGFDCSVMVLGKFEYEDEFTPFTNWDLCVYWFDEERWHPLNGYVKGDDIVRWYALPYKEREE